MAETEIDALIHAIRLPGESNALLEIMRPPRTRRIPNNWMHRGV